MRFIVPCVLFAMLFIFDTREISAASPKVMPEGQKPSDARLAPPKDLDGYFPFQPPTSLETWKARREELKDQLRVALGLFPEPTRTTLNPVIHSPIDLGDYTVEAAYFESMPGFYVTGSLYRPKNKKGPFPAVLCPHGHWSEGRFYDVGEEGVKKEIVIGAERFANGGRSPLQSRCVQLARMGCVVFHYDMIGYADSVQLTFDLAHRFATQRPEMNKTDQWGLFSPQAEAHGQSIMGLQTWNSIRSLDFVQSLPDVDAKRIAVTGASGGGTQTFLLCALDDRPVVAAPIVMVSTAMQGGCTCENCSLLRVNTGNVEIASLFAPKPQILSTANDWTKEMSTKGFPDLKKLYELYGAGEMTSLINVPHFEHNYNYVTRARVYSWFNKHLGLNLSEPIVEEDYRRLSREELTIWKNGHAKPDSTPDFERKLLSDWAKNTKENINRMSPTERRSIIERAWNATLLPHAPKREELSYQDHYRDNRGDYTIVGALVRSEANGSELPCVFLRPNQPDERVVLWLSRKGKAALFDGDGNPVEEARTLLKNGYAVASVDLFGQGEFLEDAANKPANRVVKNPRQAPAYTYGYNKTLFAHRVEDAITMIEFAALDSEATRIDVVALDEISAPVAAAAIGHAKSKVASAALDLNGFRFGKLLDYLDERFQPCAATFDDVYGLLSLSKTPRLWVRDRDSDGHDTLKREYENRGAGARLSWSEGTAKASEAVAWILAE